MVISGIIVFTENILMTMFLHESTADIKGLYWILRSRQKQGK
jgi:hypothetical protein